MMYLLSSTGIVDHRFGILATPHHHHVCVGIQKGMSFGVDNEAFTGIYNHTKFMRFLAKLEPYKTQCLFVSVPDTLADPVDTLAKWHQYHTLYGSWPLAYVAQDGSEDYPIPKDASTLFVGGTSEWKDSKKAALMIRRAQERGMHIHIGRVNEWQRYRNFSRLENGREFTCDGTKQRFIGRERSVKLYWSYMVRSRRQIHLPLFSSDSLGQP